MNDFSQVAAQITQMRDFFVNEAVATAQQVQAGTRQVQAPPPAVVGLSRGGSYGLFWFGLGTIAALVVAHYLWRR
jgi:cytochrome oxidase assembly protein ShyY1